MQRLLGVKKKDQLFEEGWLKAALKEYPSTYGIAIVSGEGDEQGMQILKQSTDKDHPALTFEVFDGIQKNFKEEHLIVSFGRSSASVPVEEQQPFVIFQNEDESPALVAFIAGDYPGFTKISSSYSPEYHVWQDELIRELGEMAELCDGDVDKLMLAFTKPGFDSKIKKLWAGKANTIVFMSQTDKYILFKDNDDLRDYPWGIVSNHLNWDKPAAAPLPATVAAKGKSLTAALTAAASAVGATVVGKLGPAPVKEKETDTAEPAMWYPPPNIFGKSLKALYRQKTREYTGVADLPSNWEERPGLPIPKGKGTIKSLADLPPVAGNTAVAATKNSPVTAQKPADPILSPLEIEAIEEEFLTKFDHDRKIVDSQNNLIGDLDVMQALEAQTPPVWEQLGCNLENFYLWKDTDWEHYAIKYPRFSSLMNLALCGIVMRQHKVVEPAKPSEKADVKAVPVVGKAAKRLLVPPKVA